MDEITKGIHEVYDTREKYIIIGLTGRTGSGCSKAAELLSSTKEDLKLIKPRIVADNQNESRKFSIIKRFIDKNWEPFVWIKIKDIITSFILEVEKEVFINYVAEFIEPENTERQNEIKKAFLESCGKHYDLFRSRRLKLKDKIEDEEERTKSKAFYFEELPEFTDKIKNTLNELLQKNYTKIYQRLGDNIRSSGSTISSDFSAKKNFQFQKGSINY